MNVDPGRTWMAFVDGENIVMRAQEVSKDPNGMAFDLVEGPNYRRDTSVWLPAYYAINRLAPPHPHLKQYAARSLYYTSVCGDEELIATVTQQLWSLGFSPNVFKKQKQQTKAKGVDIALTKDMLSHAFRNNYETAVLMAGDGDYIPLVEEVKSLGKQVYLCFFKNGLSPKLKLACDAFFDITPSFIERWQSGPNAAPGRPF